jgi:hypothetical protein
VGERDVDHDRLRRGLAVLEWTWLPVAAATVAPAVALAVSGSPLALAVAGLGLPAVMAGDRMLAGPLRAWHERWVVARALRRFRACDRIADAEDGQLVIVHGVASVLAPVRHPTRGPCAAYLRWTGVDVAARNGRLAIFDRSAVAVVEPSRARFEAPFSVRDGGAIVRAGDRIAVAGRARWTSGEGGGYRDRGRVCVIEPAIAGSIAIRV